MLNICIPELCDKAASCSKLRRETPGQCVKCSNFKIKTPEQ